MNYFQIAFDCKGDYRLMIETYIAQYETFSVIKTVHRKYPSEPVKVILLTVIQ